MRWLLSMPQLLRRTVTLPQSHFKHDSSLVIHERELLASRKTQFAYFQESVCSDATERDSYAAGNESPIQDAEHTLHHEISILIQTHTFAKRVLGVLVSRSSTVSCNHHFSLLCGINFRHSNSLESM